MSWMPQPPRPTPPVVRPSRQSAAFAKRGRSCRRIAWFTPTQVGNTWGRGCPHPLSSVHPKPVGNTLHPSKRAGDVSPPLGRSLQRPIVLNRPIHIRRSPKPPQWGTSVGRPGNAVRRSAFSTPHACPATAPKSARQPSPSAGHRHPPKPPGRLEPPGPCRTPQETHRRPPSTLHLTCSGKPATCATTKPRWT